MKIKALVPWFGSKRSLAPQIIELPGPHSAYWEPFCGSMAILLAKRPCGCESVNDLHQDLLNLARTIQDPTEGSKLYRRLRRVFMHEDIVRAAKEEIQQREFHADTERAFWYFIDSWLGRNGVAGTQSTNNGFCRRFTDKGGSPAVRFESAVRSIPAWRRRLRRVSILHCDAFELLERIADDPGCVIYVDAPYIVKGAKYIHDFPTIEEEQAARNRGDATVKGHFALAETLHRFKKARVVLSYYDHPKLAELYPDWAQYKIEVSKALAHQGARGTNDVKAVEVLLVNKPPEKSGQGLLFAPLAEKETA